MCYGKKEVDPIKRSLHKRPRLAGTSLAERRQRKIQAGTGFVIYETVPLSPTSPHFPTDHPHHRRTENKGWGEKGKSGRVLHHASSPPPLFPFTTSTGFLYCLPANLGPNLRDNELLERVARSGRDREKEVSAVNGRGCSRGTEWGKKWGRDVVFEYARGSTMSGRCISYRDALSCGVWLSISSPFM